MNPREKDSGAKKEAADPSCNKFPRINTMSSSRQWSSSFKNPRIVRVSRAFGGKDRHSKVCTVRGLRDRRIRLSVPTAILLYDLQERLGLSQPSKVVDWLIEAAKHEIDELPPLPMIVPSNFSQFHGSSFPDFLSPNDPYAKGLGVVQPKDSEQENGEGLGGFVAQNFFPITTQYPLPNMPYNFHWDPPNLSLSQFGGAFPFSTQTDMDIPSYLSMEGDQYLRHINHLQNLHQNSPTLHLISPSMKSFCLSTANHSHENDNRKPEKDK